MSTKSSMELQRAMHRNTMNVALIVKSFPEYSPITLLTEMFNTIPVIFGGA